MRTMTPLPQVAWMAILLLLCWTGFSVGAEPIGYNRDVRPILSDKCFACHGPDEKSLEADLRLDQRESALTVLNLENPEDSELMKRVRSTDEFERMPPPETHKRVTKSEQQVLQQWIASGAEYEPHWSFISLTDVPVPEVQHPDLVSNEIDVFVQSRLSSAGYAPAPQADRATLIRRATLALTGLPPTPEEVSAFLNDPAADDIAFGTIVDRLLTSPAYGEHQASFWIDAARYADSDGYESDPLRNMWPWRDWVIDAFNRNLPFDQFLVEQLAADLLPDHSKKQLLATGFNRNHRLNNEGGILPEEWRIEYVADRAETTATVFMGLTWGCSRCHDHKFDPITQQDYYSLFAFFNSVPESGNSSGASNAYPMIYVSQLDQIDAFEAIEKKYEPLKAALDKIAQSNEFAERLKTWKAELDESQLSALPKELRDKPVDKWDKKLDEQAKQHFLKTIDEAGVAAYQQLVPIEKEYDQLKRTGAKVMVMGEMETPRQTHILERGAYDQPREEVAPQTPSWLPEFPENLPKNRLGLAQWLVAPEHPLTARVTVNRIWAQYFGTGIVKTPEDFGSQGAPPSHPELLDWLAKRFIDSGWDVRELHRLIAMSHTFRQSSALTPQLQKEDPENRLLARGPRIRLSAAMIRDQALASSGLLVDEIGGPPVKPYQPVGLWKEIIKGGPTYRPDSGEKLYRRSLYTLWRRAVKPPLMTLLDANERDTCAVSQKSTNTPLQALLILNDVTFVETARALAQRTLLHGGNSPEDRIRFAVQLVLGRQPSPQEVTLLTQTLGQFQAHYAEHPEAATELITIGESKPDASLNPTTLAALTALGRVLYNLDETIMLQ